MVRENIKKIRSEELEQKLIKIKPCPFCGGQAKFHLSNDLPEPYYKIKHCCTKEDLGGIGLGAIWIETRWCEKPEQAAIYWNQRN